MQEFDFDEWRKLAETDPALFELRRRQAVEALIAKAPGNRQHRLRGIQWRVDMERSKYRNSLVSCQKVFGMMWSSVYDDNGLLQALNGLVEKPVEKASPVSRGQVLAFEAPLSED